MRSGYRAIGTRCLLLLGLIGTFFLKLEPRSAFPSQLHCLDDPITAFVAVCNAGPRPPMSLYMGTLGTGDVVPVFVEVRLVDAKLSD